MGKSKRNPTTDNELTKRGNKKKKESIKTKDRPASMKGPDTV